MLIRSEKIKCIIRSRSEIWLIKMNRVSLFCSVQNLKSYGTYGWITVIMKNAQGNEPFCFILLQINKSTFIMHFTVVYKKIEKYSSICGHTHSIGFLALYSKLFTISEATDDNFSLFYCIQQ